MANKIAVVVFTSFAFKPQATAFFSLVDPFPSASGTKAFRSPKSCTLTPKRETEEARTDS